MRFYNIDTSIHFQLQKVAFLSPNELIKTHHFPYRKLLKKNNRLCIPSLPPDNTTTSCIRVSKKIKGEEVRDERKIETRGSIPARNIGYPQNMVAYLVYLRDKARGGETGRREREKRDNKRERKGRRERNINSLAFNYELNQI